METVHNMSFHEMSKSPFKYAALFSTFSNKHISHTCNTHLDDKVGPLGTEVVGLKGVGDVAAVQDQLHDKDPVENGHRVNTCELRC